MSRLHHDLARRFIDLEKSMVKERKVNEFLVQDYKAEALSIEKDEPPVLQALNDLCYNEMIVAMGYKSKELLPLPWYKRLLAHMVSFEPHHV